jgi:hypothetical protein
MKQQVFAVARRTPAASGPLAAWFGLLVGLVLMAFVALPAHAADADDPPGRVGRLSELNGQVWIFATDTNEWVAASRNRPVTTGDRLSTEADGRAEVRIGSTVLRVAPNTEVEVVRLDDDRISLYLSSGSVTARLRTREAADEFSLSTDEGRFRTEAVGQYRFDRQDDQSVVTAMSGQAVYEADGTALPVQQGQRVEFWKERGVPQYSITSPRSDDFANWVASLDRREANSVSARYVSPEMTGVEDLDRYGRWEAGTEYGAVWIPRTVVTGWAPYRMGHWVWVRPWGWTWVDDAPWGFAPFHYGRWVWYRDAWCWAPGRYVARPVYAPALVAWMGGPNVSVSVRIGSAPTVGWFPLGPREVYVPAYRVSPRYVQNVNVTHVTRITNVTTIINNPGQAMANAHYVNRGMPRAVTVVPADVVERRRPVAPAFRPVNDRELRDFNRERPRAEAPVMAPPRPAVGAQPVVDPRISRPGGPRPGVVTTRPEVRPGPPPREERIRDGRPDPRDGRADGRGRDASPQAPVNAAPIGTPQQPVAQPRPNRDDRDDRFRDGRNDDRSIRDGRGNDRSEPRVQAPQQQVQQPAPVTTMPSRDTPVIAAPPRDERRRHHDAPQSLPPPPAQPPVQVAPQPRPQPQPQVQQPQPQPVQQAPVMRQREHRPPEARPQPEQREQPRERPDRERGRKVE